MNIGHNLLSNRKSLKYVIIVIMYAAKNVSLSIGISYTPTNLLHKISCALMSEY